MYIGIDLGTSSVKCILVNEKGKILRSISKKSHLLMPSALSREQNPEEWFTQTMYALQELIDGFEEEIIAIGLSGQMHGLVVLDGKDQIIRNALLWNDQRTIDEVEYLNREIGIDNLLKFNGNIALTGLTAPKILWMRKNEPEMFNQINKIMLPKDYLVYRLTGIFASDVTDMSGSLFFDPRTKTYSEEILRILGITKDVLPRVFESSDCVGVLNDEIKSALRIKQDIKVIIGAGDQAAGAIGIGLVDDGDCGISLGTSGVVFVATDAFHIDKKSNIQSYAHANGKYHMMSVMLSCAGSLKWWNENIIGNYNYENFFHNIAQSNSQEDLYFLPYLSGERAPINDPLAKGVLFGLSTHHTKRDIDRAIVEGITYALRESLELIKKSGININKVRITGGGAKNDIVAQLIADILNVEVYRLKIEEGPAFGAAVLAMVGHNIYSNVNDASKAFIEIRDVFTPNLNNTSQYNKKYEKFVEIYPQIKALYRV